MLVALLASSGPVCAAVPPAAPPAELPQLGQSVRVERLKEGGLAIVRPLSGAPVAAIALWYRVPSIGFEVTAVPSLARLAAQTVVSSKLLTGNGVGSLVRASGGRLAISTYADSIAIAALVPASDARPVVRALTAAFFSPAITQAGFTAARRDVAEDALIDGFNPDFIVRQAVFGSLFASGPKHHPTLGSPKDVGLVSIDSVRAFAARAFRSQNAVLVISGAVDPSITAAAATGRPASGEAAAPEMPVRSAAALDVVPVTQAGDESAGGYGWVGPAITNEREATAMDFIADYLFRPHAGVVARAIESTQPDSSVSGQYITLRDPGVLFVAFSGKTLDPIRDRVDAGLSTMRKPLDPQVFSAARAAFEAHILSDLQTPLDVADNFGWFVVEGNAEYAPGANGENGAYFRALHSLTPEFVAAVAERYLSRPSARVTLMPKPGSKVGR